MAVVAFAACDNDENEELELPEVIGKRLVKVESSSSSIIDGEEFTYSDGKLTGYASYEIYQGEKESQSYSITYSDNTVTVTNLSRTGGEKEESVYTLNAEGYAVSMVHTDIEEYEGEFDTETYHCTFEYSDGYLVKIVDDDEGATTINYQDGDVVSYSQMGRTYQCVASSILNKGGILPFLGWLGDTTAGELAIVHYADILGKSTKHLLSTEGNYTYKYELDDEEYVKTCTATSASDHEGVLTYTFN